MRRTLVLWVGVLAALLMVAAACGGGGDKESATLTPAARTTAAATSSPGTSVSKAELANDLKTIKAVMQETIAKAQAGDVEGTREAEGKGDEAIEAIIKAVRPLDASLADSIEKLELDYEAQADSSNPDLAVIAKDAQDVLPLLDQAASKLGISP
jgi:hypothetical protein